MKPKSAFLCGTAVLTAGACGAKLLGAVFKIPLARLLGPEGAGHFGVTYSIYLLVLNAAAAGMPLAMSRLICGAMGDPQREGTLVRTGLLLFGGVGCLWGGAMLLFAQPLASWMRDPDAVHGIRVLAPAVVFACVGSAFRGYFQGHQQMAPTAAVQLMEALCKLLLGLAAVTLALRAGWDIPRASAAAVLGVTVGAGTGLCVLAGPIQQLLYGYDAGTLAVAGPVLAVLGPASGLHCMVLVTNAILQARGKAGWTVWSAVLGGVVQLTVTHVLTGQSRFDILGAALGTLAWDMTVLICNGLLMILLGQEEKK